MSGSPTLAPLARLAPQQPRFPVLTQLARQRLAPVAMGLVGLLVVAAVFASVIAPYEPNNTEPSVGLQRTSASHVLGTDRLGRDVFSRMVFGARVSLTVGIISVSLSMIAGVPLGLISGFFGGWVDPVIMRLMDALLAFPQLVLALAIVGVFGAGFWQVMVAIGVGTVPLYARLTRGQVLSLREQDYVLAARTLGASNRRILVRHILPNGLSPLFVQGSLGVAFAILAEAGLSFLGVGVQPPNPTWGGMLSDGLPLITTSAYLSVYPGIAIFISVLAINTIGDSLRDVLDPRLRGRK